MATRVKLLHTAISPTLAGASFTGDVNFEGGQVQYDASSNSLKFGDGIYAQFGASDDLRIYHNGTDSYIQEAGTGNLNFKGNGSFINFLDNSNNLMAYMVPGGSVGLYHNTSKKFETSSGGATVTGTLTVTGDLDITGNVNSASVTDLDVTDKTITLGVGQTEAQSGGSGIVIDGSSASMLWDETTDVFDFNKGISTTGNVGIGVADPLTALHVQGSNSAILRVDAQDGGAAPAMTSRIQLYGYEGRGAGIKIRDSVNSASSANDREWFVGSGYAYGGFNIGYAGNGSQSEYSAQAKLAIGTNGNVGIGTVSPGQKLEVAGRVRATTDPTFEAWESSTKRGGVQWNASSDYLNVFSVGGNIILDSNGNHVGVGPGGMVPNQWASYTDNGATVFQVKDTSDRARIVINGGNGAHLDLVDYAGSANDKHMNIAVDAGILKFGSLNDAGSAFVQNDILVMDLGTGNVGAGTASPSYKFDVYGTDDITMRIHRPSSGLAATDTCGIGFSQRGDTNTSTSDTRAAIVSTYNGSLHLCTEPGGNLNSNPVDHSALSIVGTDQNVGIGTNSPSDKLHIVHDSSITNDTVDVVRIEATSSGTPAVGFGPVIDFRGERAGASSDSMGRVGFVADVMTSSRIDGAFVVETAVDGTYTEHLRITSAGKVGIGTPTVSSGAKLEVSGGRIYVPNSTVQASSALIGAHTNYKWKEQATGGNGQYAAPSANKTAAYIGSNGSSVGVVIQRDSVGNTFPDFAITESGYTYVGNNITMQNGGNDSADYRAGAPGYVNWGSKIESHEWKNWSATGSYTARLYTPIVHNESNMFQIEIDVFGYSTGGRAQRYVGGGYAYSGSSLISHGTVALSGSLTHRLTTATHPNYSSTVIVFDIGYSNNNGTNYYNHMRWRYQGWNGKRAEDFVWGAVTT